MPHFPKLGTPPPIGTPLDSPEWLAWKKELSDWYYGIIDECGIEAFRTVARERNNPAERA